jgi:SAM-dependent methyltransferase
VISVPDKLASRHGDGPRKLHLGCFDRVFEGWINVDITPHIFVSRVPGFAYLLFKLGVISAERYSQHRDGLFRRVRYLDVRKKFPWREGAFEFVYTSHLLEHLYPMEALQCLREVHRVLKRGGTLRIAIPDLDEVMKGYDPQDPSLFLEALFESDQRRHRNKHHWHYNEKSLRAVLSDLGFADITRQEFRRGSCADLELIEERPKSLFMEASK